MSMFKSKEHKDLLDDNATDIRKAAVDYLRTHRNWYRTSTVIYGFLWNGLTLSIIVMSATTSIIAAYDKENEYKMLVILLSAMTALFGTLLAQFRVRDLWQIREQGRIDCEELISKAHLIDTGDAAKAREVAVDLRLAAHKIERDQTEKFFAEPKKNSAPTST